MTDTIISRPRAVSHKDYLGGLERPSGAEVRRISQVQERNEAEIERKYHTNEEHDAATIIQKAYRGHRERRQFEGLTLGELVCSRAISVRKVADYTAPRYQTLHHAGLKLSKNGVTGLQQLRITAR